MNLLGSALYDPAVAVSKATSSLLAMTALDTSNLRLAITVPAHGKVRFKMRVPITGATTSPTVLLGVLNGATVIGRVAPTYENATANAATQNFVLDAEFTATGLTPGAMNVDMAYAVQVIVASTNIKYGGPNTNAGANAWGAALFEAWDPQPMPTAAPGAANGLLIAGANAGATFATLTSTGAFTVNGVAAVSQTGDSFARIGAPAGASMSADMAAIQAKTTNLPAAPASTTNITAGTITTVTNLTNAPTAGDLTATMKTSVTAAATAATPTAAAVTAGVTLAASQHVIVDSGTVTTLTNLPAITAGWLTAAGIAASALNGKGDWNIGKTGYSLTQTFPTNFAAMSLTVGGLVTLAGVTHTGAVIPTVSAVTGLTASNLDAAVSTRSTYAGADTAGTTTLLSRLTSGRATGLDNLDATVSSRLASVSYSLPPSAAAIRAEIDTNSTGLAAIYARTDVATSTRLASASYTAPPTAAANASAVRTELAVELGRIDATTSSRLAATGYTVPDNVSIAAIKTKSDQINFTVAGKVDANMIAVNSVPLTGSGASGDRFGV